MSFDEQNKINALLEITDIPRDSLLYLHLVHLADEQHSYQHIKDCIFFLPRMETRYLRISSSTVLGLRSYPETQGIDPSCDLPEPIRDQCLALAIVLESIESDEHTFKDAPVLYNQDGGYYLRESALKSLVISRPDDAHAIARIISERKIIDANHVAELLEISASTEHALADGVL